MSMVKIAKHLKVSRSTLYRIRDQISDNEDVDDAQLSEIIQELKLHNPQCGEKYVTGHLRATGKRATRKRVRKCLREVDPIGTVYRQRLKTHRGVYVNPGPNYLWHIDGNEKLQMFKLYIHGSVDGYSRKLFYLQCTTNKESLTVLQTFKDCVRQNGFSRIVRSDKGGENVEVATFMMRHRGVDSHCYITGKSVHNVRIERLWREVNKITLVFKKQFREMQAAEDETARLDLDNEVHLAALAYIFIPRIQKNLNIFLQQWNFHSIRTAHNKSPNELYVTGQAVEVPLVVSEVSDDEASDSDNEASENEPGDESQNISDFQRNAQRIVPNPLDNDGANGRNYFVSLIRNLSF